MLSPKRGIPDRAKVSSCVASVFLYSYPGGGRELQVVPTAPAGKAAEGVEGACGLGLSSNSRQSL